jgi:hypothetical protein
VSFDKKRANPIRLSLVQVWDRRSQQLMVIETIRFNRIAALNYRGTFHPVAGNYDAIRACFAFIKH